jgi:signal transduction histidine kinase
MLSDRRFNRLVVAAVTLGFALLIATGIAALATILQNQSKTRLVDHTYRVERAIGHYRVLSERLEAARRGLLLRNETGLQNTFTETEQQIEPVLAQLRQLTIDNPRQQENVARAIALSRMHVATLNHSIALLRQGGRDRAIASFNVDESLPLIRKIRKISDRMTAEEDRLLQIREAAQRRTLISFYVTVAVAALLLIIVGGGSIWIIVGYTRDLTRSRDALHRLNTNLEGAVRERTRDLQRANDEIQRFAYIVSHDLRAPLVNILGFTAELESAADRLSAMMDRAEQQAPALIDKGARLAVREDLPEAIGFIRTSSQKMDRLINAILRLSREGRRPITPEPLDMRALLQGVADMHRHQLDERGIELTIAPDIPDIVSDRLAIEQIVDNIVGNAIKYTAPDRPRRIEIGGRTEGQRAIIEITDNGRGIDPRDHDRIFDLFRRSGQQDQPGEGIGLAHTRALAYRLGGTISVESELGKGATFRIDLPIAFGGEQGFIS